VAAHETEVAGGEGDHAHADPAPASAKPLPRDVQASLVDGKPEDIAVFLTAHPGQRDQVLRTLHEQRGNAFVGQVMAIASSAKAAVPPAAPAAELADDDGGDHAVSAKGPVGYRFGGDLKLGEVERGAAELKPGEFSPSVRKIQQALRELGYMPINVTGTFDQHTVDRVKDFQTKEKLARTDGVVDSETFTHIEQSFYSLKQYANTAQTEAPGIKDNPKHGDADNPPTALMRDTHALDAAETAEAADVITVHEVPGKPTPKFKEHTKAGHYNKRVEKALQERIDTEHERALMDKESHDTGQTFEMSQMVNIGNAAKGCVDGVYSSYATGPTMEAGVNLKDRFEADRDEQSTMKADRKHTSALSRAEYFMNIDPAFVTIDKEHHADRTRHREQGIIEHVVERIAKKNEEKLLLITATWAASTNRQGVMKIQRIKTGDDDTDRRMLWSKFGSMIHEYCHSLVHPRWHEFRDKKEETDPQGAHALAEGVTELLTRVALSKVNLQDDKLQSSVEGSLHAGLNPKPDPDRSGHYDEGYQRAQALVGTVGIYNLYAAYFLGQTHLIGA
jgi:peptidoglycan hydrolase-like protein with peptidoglycan-binding domain